MGTTWTQSGKVDPKWTQNGHKLEKWIQNGPKLDKKWNFSKNWLQPGRYNHMIPHQYDADVLLLLKHCKPIRCACFGLDIHMMMSRVHIAFYRSGHVDAHLTASWGCDNATTVHRLKVAHVRLHPSSIGCRGSTNLMVLHGRIFGLPCSASLFA